MKGVAVIGCGAVAVTHAEVLAGLNKKILYFCDVKEERAENFAGKYGGKAERDYKNLPVEELEAVHLCVPHYLHAPMSEYFLRKKVSVLCEKPVCMNEDELTRVCAAQKESGTHYGVCFQNRYLKRNRIIEESLKGEKILGIKAFVTWKREGDYYLKSGWRGKKKTEGGSVMINQAIHTLDLMLHFCGMPVRAGGKISNYHLKGVIDTEDTAEGYFESEGGGKGLIFATTACYEDSPVQIEIKTESKDITVFKEKLYINGRQIECDDKIDMDVPKDYWGKGHYLLIKDFYDKLKSGEKFWLDAEEGGKSLKVLRTIYRSAGMMTEVK